MDQTSSPNGYNHERDMSISSTASSATITSQSHVHPSIPYEPVSPTHSQTQSHAAPAKFPVKMEPSLLCGLLRTKPDALSAHPEQYYYSERSYPTPMVAPSPDVITAQVDNIRKCRAALKPPGTETETVVQKRQRQANERVFRYKNERTYRVLPPRFMKVIEAPIPAAALSTPRRLLRFSPQDSSSVTSTDTVQGSGRLSRSSSSGNSQMSATPSPNPRMIVTDSDDVEIKLEDSDVEMLEDGNEAGPSESMEIDDDDKDKASDDDSETIDNDEEEFKYESSNTEVMTVNKAIGAKAESRRSTQLKYNDSESEDADKLNHGDYLDKLRPRRKLDLNFNAAKSKVTKSKPAKSKLAKSKVTKSKVAQSKVTKSKAARSKAVQSKVTKPKRAQSKPAQSKVAEQKPAKPKSKSAPNTQHTPTVSPHQSLPAQSKVAEQKPAKPKSKSAPNTQQTPTVSSHQSLPVQNQSPPKPVSSNPPRRPGRIVNQLAFSKTLLAVPRILKQ